MTADMTATDTARPAAAPAPEGVGLPDLLTPAIAHAYPGYPAYSAAQMRSYASAALAQRTPAGEGVPSRLRGAAEDVLRSIDDLISDSEGVYGLHRNGDPAPWSELTEGGAFEEWLRSIEVLRSALAAPDPQPTARDGASAEGDSLVAYLRRQWAWSKETFGPALRTKGIAQHIRKELIEIEADPHDLSEWIDVIILAMDGFWRHGGAPEDLLSLMQVKQDKNFARTWPDWRTMGEDQAIEHDRSGEAPAALAARGTGNAVAGDLVALSEAATPGPWTMRLHGLARKDFAEIDGVGWSELASVTVQMEDEFFTSVEGIANLKLIVAAVNDLRARIAASRRAGTDGEG